VAHRLVGTRNDVGYCLLLGLTGESSVEGIRPALLCILTERTMLRSIAGLRESGIPKDLLFDPIPTRPGV